MIATVIKSIVASNAGISSFQIDRLGKKDQKLFALSAAERCILSNISTDIFAIGVLHIGEEMKTAALLKLISTQPKIIQNINISHFGKINWARNFSHLNHSPGLK